MPRPPNIPKRKVVAQVKLPQQNQVTSLIEQGLALHQQGKLNEAQAIYERVLVIQENHFEALQLLGALSAQMKQFTKAVEFLTKALRINPNHAACYSNRGIALKELTRYEEALESYDKAILIKVDYAEAHSNRGNALQALKRYEEALESYDKAILIKVDYADAHSNRGNTLQALKRYEEALESYDKAISIKPNFEEAHSNRGNTLQELKRFEEALESYDKAISIKPNFEEAYSYRGNALQSLERFEEALESYDKAILIKPDYANAYSNRGNALQALKRFEEALESYDKAISIKPNFEEAYSNRGNALQRLTRFNEALENYNKAILIKKDFAGAHYNRGNALQALKRFNEALKSYNTAISLKPDYADAHFNHGNTLKETQRFEDALASYDAAIRIKSDYVDAYYNRGNTLIGMGLYKEAQASYKQALSIKPEYTLARWAYVMSTLPIIQSNYENTQSSRIEFLKELAEMQNWFEQERLEGYKAIGSVQPFYLAYQEENNRELLSNYGALCNKLMGHWQQKEKLFIKAKNFKKPIKIGIVSKHIHQHSVWDAITRGWIENIDRDLFQLFFFYTGIKFDQETEFAKSIATGFINGINDLGSWANAVLDAQIDVLLYPEIGMDPMTVQLANLRLAPVQVGSWGHPETTGLPTIDYYLSADLLEPDNSEKYYTEQLIRLPNLGCFYKQVTVTPNPIDLDKFKIAADQPLLICPGVPFKYQPQHDHIFVEIARRLGKCQFIFFTHQKKKLTELLRRRLALSFLESGLNIDDYCNFLPWQPKASFYGLMNCANVFLDTIGFSGFNTAMQGVECGVPIVTREGRFMRGRLASGILKRIGLQELIAKNENDYINLVVKLASNQEYNQFIRNKIKENHGILYSDFESVRGLEQFLEDAYLKSKNTSLLSELSG
jgi:tetratricopeptide (TPR) repeat protein